jgi:hypothetical protein
VQYLTKEISEITSEVIDIKIIKMVYKRCDYSCYWEIEAGFRIEK